MKKWPLISLAILMAVGLGVWLFPRNRTDDMAKLVPPKILCEKRGAWSLFSLASEQSGRPAPRWLRPLPGGYLVAQYAWPESQWVALFHAGVLQDLFPIPCPSPMDQAFFGSAELIDAQIRPKETLVLLFAAQGRASKELPATLALDLKTKAVRWFHRAAGHRLTLTPSDPWVFLSGGDRAIWRLPLGSSNPPGKTSLPLQGAVEIPLPPEVPNGVSLLPLSSKTFLLAHTKGLSLWSEGSAWIHYPLPPEEAPTPLKFPEGLSILTKTSAGIWWQPHPGQLLQILPNGQTTRTIERAVFPCGALHGMDAQLLNLLGKDAKGRLWFGLAAPVIRPDSPKVPVDTKADEEEGWKSEEETASAAPVFSAQDRAKWEDYLKAPMDRIYIWDPTSVHLETLQFSQIWSKLAAPPEIPQPQGDGALYPPGSGLLLGLGGKVGFLPLQHLPTVTSTSSIPH